MTNPYNTTAEQEAQYQAEIWRCLMASIRSDPTSGNRFIARRLQTWLQPEDRDPQRVALAEKAIDDLADWISQNPAAGEQLLQRWKTIELHSMNGRQDINCESRIRERAKQIIKLNGNRR
jgi:hypothetical protein